MYSADEFRKFIEVEVLRVIKDLAEKNDTPEERIRMIAQHALDLIKPNMTIQELYKNAVRLDDQYPELAPVVFKIMHEYEENHGKKTLTEVQGLVKKGNYDEAQDLVKKLLEFKMGK